MRSDLLALVDHTALKPETTRADVDTLCDEALRWNVASVCVNGAWVSSVAERLAGSDVVACSVVGFPLGAMEPNAIAHETIRALEDGAAEIDMVVPIGPLLAGDEATVATTIRTVRSVNGLGLLKVILETGALSDEQIALASRIAVGEGAEFVKTSTGFHPSGGATVDAVRIMRETVGPDVGIKASGGIRTVADAEAMVAAGATRLGMSATGALAAE
ncbi:MAG: deoxyribose-phosphate aldolase [Actinomycetota bacterium]